MLRIPLLAACALVAASIDDQSLMQVSSSAMEVSTAIQQVGQAMSELPYPGKMRQMAIDALMKSVSTVEKLDDDAKALLGEIIDLLDGILGSMRSSASVDQGILNGILTATTACENEIDNGVAAAKLNAESKATTHSTCRTTEDGVFDIHASECAKVSNFQLDPSHQGTLQHCEEFNAGIDTLADWSSWFTSFASIYKSNKDFFTPLVNGCNTARGNLETQKAICDGAQNSYELAFCEWHDKLHAECIGLQGCWDNRVAAHNAIKDGLIDNGEQRKSEARVILHVRCLVNELREGNAELPGPCVPQPLTALHAEYGVNPVNIPPAPECSTSDVDVHPGSGTFADVFYVGVPHTETPSSC